MRLQLEGVWVPVVTPFRDDVIDHEALTRIARHLESQGVAGLVVGATTGEGALLQSGELEALFGTVRKAVPALPVILGMSDSSTHAAVQRARALAELRPSGLLATAPTYVRPTQAGIRRHFEAIAEAADLSVLVYNIPYRTGVNVELETLQALSSDPRIVGVKECGGSMGRMLRLVHETPLRILSGDDEQNFAALCLGAHGTIAASAHVLPHWHVRMLELLRGGQLAAARRIAVALQPIIRTLFTEPNPVPLKAWLAQQEWCTADVRSPFVPASAELSSRLAADWETLNRMVLPA